MSDQWQVNDLKRDDLLWENIWRAIVTWASSIIGYPM
jgi:hypothetical protein